MSYQITYIEYQNPSRYYSSKSVSNTEYSYNYIPIIHEKLDLAIGDEEDIIHVDRIVA